VTSIDLTGAETPEMANPKPALVTPRSVHDDVAMLPRVVDDALRLAPEMAAARGRALGRVRGVAAFGCGDSLHAAMMSAALASRASGVDWTAGPAGEMLARPVPRSWEGLAAVGVSASGSTRATVAALRKAAGAGALTVAVTARHGSPLEDAADVAFVLPVAERPHAPRVAPAVACFLVLLTVAHAIAGHRAGVIRDELERAGAVIRAAPPTGLRSQVIERVLPFVGADTALLWLGTGPHLGAARFASAKAIESGRFLSAYEDLEEWAHVQRFCSDRRTFTFVDAGPAAAVARAYAIAATLQAIASPSLTLTHGTAASWPGPHCELAAGREPGHAVIASAVAGAVISATLAEQLGRCAGRTDDDAFWLAHSPALKNLLKRHGFEPGETPG
jgi:glutamine---fructose-6-phosphate transaminase (isomerizing)